MHLQTSELKTLKKQLVSLLLFVQNDHAVPGLKGHMIQSTYDV